jgi:hypothetical protein
MKLIRQFISEEFISPLVEDVDGKKDYYIQGIFLQGNKNNRNGRVYPTDILAEQVKSYNDSFVKKNRALGEMGHPETPSINLDRVSHMITEIKQDGSNFIGKAKIMDTPYGKIVKNFIDEKVLLGVSSRGLGSVKQNSKGINEVQKDFKLSTIDIVADPSAPDAFVEGIMENYDWYYENGILKSQKIEEIRKEIRKTPSRRLQEKKIEIYSKYFENL